MLLALVFATGCGTRCRTNWKRNTAPRIRVLQTGSADWPARILVRLTIEGERVTGEERLLKDLGERIRDIVQGPDAPCIF